MTKKRIMIAVLGLVLAAAGIRLGAAWPDPSAPAPNQLSSVRIIYMPVVGKTGTLKRYAALTRHLEKTLGVPVAAVSFDDYSEVELPLARGNFEIAYMTPTAYVKYQSIAKLEVKAMELGADGRRGYSAVLICRADRNLSRVADFRGKVLAFVKKDSTSGFIYPLAYFIQELKTTPEMFAKKVVFAGNHEKLIQGVYKGKYDLGATNDMDLKRTLQEDKIPAASLRVVWTSDLIPGSPVCLRDDLPRAVKSKLFDALIAFNQDPDGLKALQIGGFAKASDRDYKQVRKLVQALGVK